MKEIAIRKDVIRKDVFYETEKASERMEDMHLFIQIALESRNSFTEAYRRVTEEVLEDAI